MKGMVMHKIDFDGMTSDGVVDLSKFKAVALVDINLSEVNEFLEEAYERTNHIFKNWFENEGVTPIADKARSTSVGDLIWIENKIYEVDSFGWKAVNATFNWKASDSK